jgi:hypothetical protein
MGRVILGVVIGVVIGATSPAYAPLFPGNPLCTEPGQKDCTDLNAPQEVPHAWGKVVGVYQSGQFPAILFEAPDGTLRSTIKNRQTVVRNP